MVSLVCSTSRLCIRLVHMPEQDCADAGVQIRGMLSDKQQFSFLQQGLYTELTGLVCFVL